MTSQRNRLTDGGLIDRTTLTSFEFDGKRLTGHPGDTLASALMANGIRLVGRSFKYHRPRGFLSAGPEEPNGLVELGAGSRREPNTKATTVELFEGLVAASQNRWPSLRFDISSVNSLLSPFLGAGFYYKTFMWPAAFWEKVYEPVIRRAAGLGRAATQPDPDRYEKAFAFCDVLVIGGGPAGLQAARTAGRTGARVILVEDDFRLGGRLLSEQLEIDGKPGHVWAANVEGELAAMPEVTILRRTALFALYDGRTYCALQRVTDHLGNSEGSLPRQKLWNIVAKSSVLATGAHERPIVFGGNDVPGVMLASAVRTYINRFSVSPGEQFVVFTSGDDGWRTALDLLARGLPLRAVVDSRPHIPDDMAANILRAGVRVMTESRVVGTKGGRRLKAIMVVDSHGRAETITANVLAISNGWNPTIGLATHLGGRALWSNEINGFVANDLPAGMSIAGAADGAFTLAQSLAEGAAKGARAAMNAGFDAATESTPRSSDDRTGVAPLWHIADTVGKAFVDFQNDVTVSDVALAAQEGFLGAEHLKRYTTLGMATDQGKTSNVNGLAIMAHLTGRAIAEVGTTTARPPQLPVAIAAFAGPHRGPHFRPLRLTAGHGWAEEQGAKFVKTGPWLRAQWFPRPGDVSWHDSVNREVQLTRTVAGICDVSTLGKIDIQGADAGIFLDRIYVNTFSVLPVGKARYGLMLREDGFIFDDGTTARLTPEHFVMSTTTANAARVMQHLEYCHQVLWPNLDVQMVSVTEQWAQYAVAGPRSRELLQAVFGTAIDLSNDAFPYLACSEFRFGAPAVRIFRLSFSGELAFEVAVPARFGDEMIRRLVQAGKAFGATPYGTEALGVMRVEKGHVAGSELTGDTTANDVGLGRMMSKKKDFIGRVMTQRPALLDPDRPSLVGITAVNPADRLRAGAHLLENGAAATTETDQGYLSSAVFSVTLGHWISLAFLKRGASRMGEQLRAYDPIRNSDIDVNVVSPIFLDPEGTRLHA